MLDYEAKGKGSKRLYSLGLPWRQPNGILQATTKVSLAGMDGCRQLLEHPKKRFPQSFMATLLRTISFILAFVRTSSG